MLCQRMAVLVSLFIFFLSNVYAGGSDECIGRQPVVHLLNINSNQNVDPQFQIQLSNGLVLGLEHPIQKVAFNGSSFLIHLTDTQVFMLLYQNAEEFPFGVSSKGIARDLEALLGSGLDGYKPLDQRSELDICNATRFLDAVYETSGGEVSKIDVEYGQVFLFSTDAGYDSFILKSEESGTVLRLTARDIELEEFIKLVGSIK